MSVIKIIHNVQNMFIAILVIRAKFLRCLLYFVKLYFMLRNFII